MELTSQRAATQQCTSPPKMPIPEFLEPGFVSFHDRKGFANVINSLEMVGFLDYPWRPNNITCP
jgi:hypothetical protein